ncbi:hypothetical protein B2J93_3198 [Marssonina coronariae]|uniref:Uncharacterized protein n=1 Tax=Diplocarpon coronariae TaxID=2795749 RepID=A0A218Z483_9HELO|nr:hypothetical protein B2J93_3198 [Marssonina coronariae]
MFTAGFLNLSSEIRQRIYIEVFAPTRNVSLLKARDPFKFTPIASDSNGVVIKKGTATISLALLRTSKQIYSEAKNVFWTQNRVAICANLEPLYMDNFARLEEQLWKSKLQHVRLFFAAKEEKWMVDILEILLRCENLESLTLSNGTVTPHGDILCNTPAQFVELTEPDLISAYRHSYMYQEPAPRFRPCDRLIPELEAAAMELALAGVGEKKLEFNRMDLSYNGIRHVMWEMHRAFGGELWVNRALVMKDGKLMDVKDESDMELWNMAAIKRSI